jgi:hypothetical protein
MLMPWGFVMLRKILATVMALAVPVAASADTLRAPATPLQEAIEKSGRQISAAQSVETRSRGRFWTGIALIAGGGALGALSAVEFGDDEVGPDDGEDSDNSDDGEDSDGLNKAMLGGGIAAATLGGVLLITGGGKKARPVISMKRGGFSVKQTIRF